MWKSFVEPGRPQVTIRRLRIAGWITKATDTQNMKYLLFLKAKIFSEGAWLFPYARVACLVLLLVRLLTKVTYQPDVVSDSIHIFRQSICTLTCLMRYSLL